MSNVIKTWVDDPSLLETTMNEVKKEHSARINMDKALLRLYYQRPVTAVSNPLQPYAEMTTFETLQQLGFNLSREVIDASCAMICRPLQTKVLPVGGDFELQRASKQLGTLGDGIDDAVDYLGKATQAYRDSCSATIGPMKWYVDDETQEISLERLDPLSVFWHYDEGDNPVHLYTETAVPRAVLRERFPRFKQQIDDLPHWRQPTIVGVTPPGTRGGDTVCVNEAWRRKLGSSKGRHLITAGKFVLLPPEKQDWGFDFHPIVSSRWSRDYLGYGGVPLGRVIAPYHIWSNQLVRQVFDALKGSVPWLLTHEDSLVDNVSDVPFQQVKYSGSQPPTVVTPKAVSDQVLQEIAELRTRAHAEAGVNQQAAQGTRPTGLNSAPSQREWVDIASMRSIQQQKGWEQLAKDSMRVKMALAATAYKSRPARVRAPGTDLIEEIKFPDIQEDKYRVTVGLASGLSLTVSGRKEQLADLRELGIIDTADFARHLDIPDIKQLSDRVNAPRDLAEKQISAALNDNQFIMPSALQGTGLDSVIALGSQEYQRAMVSGKYPPENMECLRKLIKAAEARKPKPPAPAPPAQPQPIPVKVIPDAPAGGGGQAPPAAAAPVAA